jgi:hypothetical protein
MIRLSTCSHIVVQNIKIYDTYENAVTANFPGTDYNNITMRNMEISLTAGMI